MPSMQMDPKDRMYRERQEPKRQQRPTLFHLHQMQTEEGRYVTQTQIREDLDQLESQARQRRMD